MGEYKDDMSAEKKPAGLIPEGHRQVRIIELIEGTSKSGNKMFTGSIEDIKTKTNMPVWLVNEPKKRWLLKSLLGACGCAASADGIYDWSKNDVIGKTVTAIVEHYTEPWINKEGIEVKVNKAKVTEFIAADSAEVIWNE